MTAQNPEALRLADKYEVEGFLQDHRFAQNDWCRKAAVELRRLHAANVECMEWNEAARQDILSLRAQAQELEAQLESIGAGGVEPLRRRDHFRDAAKMVSVGWAISHDGKTPHALWTEGEGDLLDLEVKRQGGTACKMELFARVEK